MSAWRIAATVPCSGRGANVRVFEGEERTTFDAKAPQGFYRYLFAIDPDEFASAGNEAVVAALEAEGIPAELQYPPMSRYDLFQPRLSRLPVCVEYADRLDPSRMSFPVAEAAGEREAVYLNECVFRAGRAGVEDVVTALAKVQQHAQELAPARA